MLPTFPIKWFFLQLSSKEQGVMQTSLKSHLPLPLSSSSRRGKEGRRKGSWIQKLGIKRSKWNVFSGKALCWTNTASVPQLGLNASGSLKSLIPALPSWVGNKILHDSHHFGNELVLWPSTTITGSSALDLCLNLSSTEWQTLHVAVKSFNLPNSASSLFTGVDTGNKHFVQGHRWDKYQEEH